MFSNKWLLAFLMMAVSMAILSGCRGGLESQLRDRVVGGETFSSFDLLGVAELDIDQRIAVYTGSNHEYDTIGFVILHDTLISWKEGRSGAFNRQITSSAPSTLVDIHQTPPNPRFKDIIIYGQIFSPEVKLIQLELKDGTKHDIPITNNFFALTLPKSTPIIIANVMDSRQNMLEQIEISENP